MMNPFKATTFKSLPQATKSKVSELINKFDKKEKELEDKLAKTQKQIDNLAKLLKTQEEKGEKNLEKLYKKMSKQELNIVKKSVPKETYNNYIQWFQKNRA